jgi:hypothetical protein
MFTLRFPNSQFIKEWSCFNPIIGDQWYELMSKLNNVNLSNEDDMIL